MRAVQWAVTAVLGLGLLGGCASGAGARAAPAAKAAPAQDMESGKRVAMVLLDSAGLPAPADVVAAYGALARAGEPVPRVLQEPVREDAQVFQFADDAYFLVMEMPGPIPEGEAEGMADHSVARLGEGWKVPEQRRHLVVLMADAPGRPLLETQRRFTWALAAVTQATPAATGVYLGDGHVTHPRDFFLSAAKGEELATHLTVWNGVSIAGAGEDRVSLVSLGMEPLGQPNLRVTAPREQGPEAMAYLFDLLTYAVRRGAPVPEGETVGRDAVQRLKVRYEPSPVEPDEQVWRVDLP